MTTASREPGARRAWTPGRAMTVTVLGTVAYTQPVFLVGALAVQVTEELAFGVAGIGLAVGLFRGTAALTSAHMGRLADRLGSVTSLRLAAGVAAVASAGLALTAVSLATFSIWLVVAGTANAIGQPATNRLLQRHIPPERQGIAFGVKQAAVPTSTMLAGFAVPLIALTLGWRWAFAGPAVLTLLLLAASRGVGQRPAGSVLRRSRDPGGEQAVLEDRATIVLLSAAIGLGMAGASAAPAFFVDSAVTGGLRPDIAGLVLAGASIATILSRLLAGYVADRLPGGQLRMAAVMVLLGSVGYALLAVGGPSLYVVGIVIAMALGWGFNGVFWYCLVQAYPDTPGRATGAVAPGGLLGSSLGPIIFGVVVERTSYTVGWTLAGLLGLVAAVVMFLAAERLKARDVHAA